MRHFKSISLTAAQEARFWSLVNRSAGEDACWPWVGRGGAKPHGIFYGTHAEEFVARRVAYTLAYGPIASGAIVRANCGDSRCCNPHHLRIGSFLGGRYDLTPTQESRFWSRVDRSGGDSACWPWVGNRTKNGYGRFLLGRGQLLAHRVAYALIKGSPPDDLLVCHNCPGGDNRWCCNPAHLWLGTIQDNNRDCVNKGRQAVYIPFLGERNGMAKLTEPKVRAIRIQYGAGYITLQALADFYDVSLSLISQVVNRKIWKHVA